MTNNSLSLLHTNISSLQANIEQLEDLMHDLDFSFDIIALSETWNPETSKQSFSPKKLDGYLDYMGTTGSSQNGGCGLYVKDTFTPIPRSDLEFKINDFGCETENCWIELINEKSTNILIGVFYRHPSKSNHIFQEKFKQTLKKINKEKKKIMICGDFNLNLINFDNDKQVSSFLSSLLQYNLQPCITEPTRIKNTNKPSLVDNIFINTLDDPVCGNILELISHDHLPNFAIIKHEHNNKIIHIKKRDTKNYDPLKLQKDLLNNGQFLLALSNEPTSEAAMNLYMNRYTSLLDKQSPLRNLSKKELKTAKKPWLTKGLLISISRKRKLFKKFKNDKLKNIEGDTFKEYKSCNDMINRLKKLSKKNHFNNYFLENAKNAKETWRGINQLLNKSKKNRELFS